MTVRTHSSQIFKLNDNQNPLAIDVVTEQSSFMQKKKKLTPTSTSITHQAIESEGVHRWS